MSLSTFLIQLPRIKVELHFPGEQDRKLLTIHEIMCVQRALRSKEQ